MQYWHSMTTGARVVACVQPGDCIILNAANSTVGQLILQLCCLLHLRCVAVIRHREQTQQNFNQSAAWLKTLGAAVVLEDVGSLKVSLAGSDICH